MDSTNFSNALAGRHKIVLDPSECAVIRSCIQDRGDVATGFKLGVGRACIVRAALGLTIYAETAITIRKALAGNVAQTPTKRKKR